MAYTPLQLSIPKPCHERWDKMTPEGKNQRHCDSCAKNVTDFTWMTDREIHNHLATAGNKVCGRFRPDQLRRPVRAVVLPATGWRAVAAAAGLVLAAGTVGPMTEQVLQPPVTGEIADFQTEQCVVQPEETGSSVIVTSTFGGIVRDESGYSLANTLVRVVGLDRSTHTDEDGFFTLQLTGGQQLSFFADGYDPLRARIGAEDAGFTTHDREFLLTGGYELMGDISIEPLIEMPPVMGLPVPAFSGRVIDEAGDPLVGASVVIAGTGRGTVTNEAGYFSLDVGPGVNLQFSFVGFDGLETSILLDDAGFSDAGADYTLFSAVNALEEIVVVGYSTTYVMGAVITGINIDPAPQLQSIAGEDKLSVFPNPFINSLNVSFFAGDAGAVTARLLAMDGRVVREWQNLDFLPGPVTLELKIAGARLTAGTYALVIENAEGILHRQLVIADGG